jgi:hypothetical protein
MGIIFKYLTKSFVKEKQEEIWYVVDGADSYCEESDFFNLRNSCLKLVREISEDKIMVIADDDMFAAPSIYTINPKTKEILSKGVTISNAKQLAVYPKLRSKYYLVRENIKRGVLPEGIEDRRFLNKTKKNESKSN